MPELILGGITLLNRIVVTGILITAFALVIYIGLYNRRSPIARAFAGVLLCVIATYFFDLMAQISTIDPWLWLRLQWLGIALIPAVSLDLSDKLLRATGDNSPTRRWAVKLEYGAGIGVVLLVIFSELLATSGLDSERLPHLKPGVLYLAFTFYYFASTLWSTYNVVEARRRSLTTTSKRRMTYFVIAFAAPALGMFPYLLPAGWPDALPDLIPWTVILLVNMGVGAAITFMGYTVAYFGSTSPDRIVKRRLIKYLMRGPLLAALVITAIVFSARIERWFNLQGPAIGLVFAATIILMAQLLIVTMQPALDRFIAGDDSDEVRRLQQFSERLMTTSDLTQYLENILAALCDLLRARTAFVTMTRALREGDPPQVVTIGSVDSSQIAILPDIVRTARPRHVEPAAPAADAAPAAHEAAREAAREAGGSGVFTGLFRTHDATVTPFNTDALIRWNGYWLIPLFTRDTDDVLGVIGLVARASEPDLTEDERKGVAVLVLQAARALEDAAKQQLAFEALERIVPEAEDMQRRMAGTRYPAAPTLQDFEFTPANPEEFTQQVRDALSQFWGGPKLTGSPLMNLTIVEEAVRANNGNATKALRAVLNEAIERLRPDGQRSMTQAEWMLYNILELKIIQDLKVRDVARRLVMSESDLYRKQRAAFEEVARIMIDMEREARRSKLRQSGEAAEEPGEDGTAPAEAALPLTQPHD